jgi:16S rRNA (guanine527-N7)-methyltransferase
MRPDRRPSADPAELALRLRQGAAELGLVLAEPVLRRLLEFVALLARWNAVYNLTAIRDPRDMLVQHLLDALSIVPPLRRRLDLDRSTIADVGSGAGLPGLPLAIVHPGARVVSIEPVGKKTAFQRQACAELALTNVEVYTGRAESLTRAFDLVVCRAFASLADFADAAARLAGPTTLLVAMKGQRAGLDAEMAALPPDCSAEVEPLRVPFLDAERHLVLIRRARGPVRAA